MPYSAKTNWVNTEIVNASDMNRIEQGIKDVDTGKMNVNGSNAAVTQLSFSGGGTLTYNSDQQILDITNPDGSIMNVGKELWIIAKASEALAIGDLAQYTGNQGDYISVKKAVAADIIANPGLFLGVCTTSAAAGSVIKVTRFGEVPNLNTSTYALGNVLYFDPSNGKLRVGEPTTSNLIIEVGVVQKVSTTLGILMVQIFNRTNIARSIKYDNAISGLTSTNTQAAIDELAVDKHTHGNKSTLDATTASFTTTLKTKLDGVETGAQKNVATNVSVTQTTTQASIASSTGTGGTITAASSGSAGVMSAADKVKLDGIEEGATKTSPNLTLTTLTLGNYQIRHNAVDDTLEFVYIG